MDCDSIIVLSFGFICFLNDLFTLIFIIWTTKTLKILNNISSFFLFFCYFYILFLEIIYNNSCFRKIRRILYKELNINIFLIIFLFLITFENVIITINENKYIHYLNICPYTISDLDLKLHLKRRCELYNINNNSRYSYQYICSYDSSKELKIKKLSKKQKQDFNSYNALCLKVESLIKNNSIVDLFSKEYSNSDKYYCSITSKPKDFIFAKHKD